MIRKLVQKQIIPHQNSFRQELTKMILSLDLSKYSNNTVSEASHLKRKGILRNKNYTKYY